MHGVYLPCIIDRWHTTPSHPRINIWGDLSLQPFFWACVKILSTFHCVPHLYFKFSRRCSFLQRVGPNIYSWLGLGSPR